MNTDFEDIKTLLDDAAERALGTRRASAAAALAAARVRRRETLRARSLAVVAVAAAVLLGLLIVPWPLRSTAEPARVTPTTTTGLPRHLPVPSEWTPDVADAHVDRASMLLRVLNPFSRWSTDGRSVVVSADGTRFAVVPNAGLDAVLTDDGRYVVWRDVDGSTPTPVVHVVRLADGVERRLSLPLGTGPSGVVEGLTVVPGGSRILAGGRIATTGTVDDGGGNDVTWSIDAAAPSAGPPQPGRRPDTVATAPDGRTVAALTPALPESRVTQHLVLTGGSGPARTIPLQVPVTARVGLLGWGPHGVLVGVDGTVLAVDPVSGRTAPVITADQPPFDQAPDQSTTPGYVTPTALTGSIVRSGGEVSGVSVQPIPGWSTRTLAGLRDGTAVPAWVLTLALLAAVVGAYLSIARAVGRSALVPWNLPWTPDRRNRGS